jgi:hypothetical protein
MPEVGLEFVELSSSSLSNEPGDSERGEQRSWRLPEEHSNVRLVVTVRDDELEAYRGAAARAGLTVSEWVRQKLWRAARRKKGGTARSNQG